MHHGKSTEGSHMHAGTDEPDCLWLYASGNHYQLIGPMQQLIVMKAAATLGDDKDFILVPHGIYMR